MSAVLLLVTAPTLYPVAARIGDVLAWHPSRCIRVLRDDGRRCTIVRESPLANAFALAELLADGIVTAFDAEEAARIRAALAVLKVLTPITSRAAPRQRLALV